MDGLFILLLSPSSEVNPSFVPGLWRNGFYEVLTCFYCYGYTLTLKCELVIRDGAIRVAMVINPDTYATEGLADALKQQCHNVDFRSGDKICDRSRVWSMLFLCIFFFLYVLQIKPLKLNTFNLKCATCIFQQNFSTHKFPQIFWNISDNYLNIMYIHIINLLWKIMTSDANKLASKWHQLPK